MRIPLIIAAILFIFGVLVDIYIYFDIRKYHRSRGTWQGKVYIVSAIITMLLLVIAVVWPRRNDDASIIPVMWVMFSWATIYVAKLVYVIISLLGRLFKLLLRRDINMNLYVGVPAALLAVGIMWWGCLVTRRDIEVTRVTVTSSRLPAAFEGYRIIQISDLHVGTWGSDTSFVASLVDTVNSLKPDVIFFTGDVVNRKTNEIRPFLHALSRLKAKDGVYSILGNHDYGDYIAWPTQEAHIQNNKELVRLQDSIGWNLLDNRYTLLTRQGPNSEVIDTIAVIGVGNWGESYYRGYAKPDSAYSDYNDSRYKIMLTHNPKHWRAELCDKTNVDLTLSGHTHAMQFEIKAGKKKWSPAKYSYPEWGGLYTNEDNRGVQHLYVNVGAGEVGMPFRIGATPEVTLITLRR